MSEKEEIKEEKPMEDVKMEAVQEQQTPKKKGHVGLIIAIVCIVLLLVVVAGGVGAVVLLRNGKKDTQKTVTEKTDKASPYRLSGNGLEDFDLYFLQLENDASNKIYSPLSIKYALAMLNEGTDGESHKQIENIIGDYKPKKYPNNEHMSFANAMFIRDTFAEQVQESYQKNLQEKYGADVILDSFTKADPMNDWVSNRTFQLINNLLSDDVVQEDNFFLINALAIDMNWNNQLQCKEGRTIPCMMYYVVYPHEEYSDFVREIYGNYEKLNFNGTEVDAATIGVSANRYNIVKELGEDKIRQEVGKGLQDYIDNGGEMCDYTYDEWMDQYIKELDSNYKRLDSSTDFLFYTDDSIKVFAKDLQTYDNVTLQYVGVMPNTVSLEDYIKDLNAKELNSVIGKLKPLELDTFKDGVITKIHGQIPFFEYDYELPLLEDLTKLGVEDIFDINKANMTKMLEGDTKQHISDAIHKAKIEFSNDGIRAAAATAMGGAGASSCAVSYDYKYEVPLEEIDLTFDKPYLYIIRDKDTGEVWFTGKVVNPA